MIVVRDGPAAVGSEQLTLGVGPNLGDALAAILPLDDCIGCSVMPAAPAWTTDRVIQEVVRTFTPRSAVDLPVRPARGPRALTGFGMSWTDVDIDARANRLRSVKMPVVLVGAQRLLAITDLRSVSETRPVIAIGLWALFAHPFVRTGARLAGARDGLTAEIALAVHPDRYVVIDRMPGTGTVVVATTSDPIAAELIVLAIRQVGRSAPAVGPWEDPLVQAATELDLGVRNPKDVEISTILSPSLASGQRRSAAELIGRAAERLGIEPSR